MNILKLLTFLQFITCVFGCLCLEEYASGLKNPVFMENLPHKRQEFFVVEQIGYIRHFESRLKEKPKPFLDLHRDVVSSDRVDEERGILGMAIDQEFWKTKSVYLYMTVSNNSVEQSVLVKIDENGVKDTLLAVPQTHTRNNGGTVLFGEDRLLYISVGDSKSGRMAQDKSSLLGKVLRIDVRTKEGNKGYAIPDKNPFKNDRDAEPEVYALGFANPWRCSFDAGDSQTGEGYGELYCGETGEQDYDEINIVQSGGNYGWNLKEGTKCIVNQTECDDIRNEKLPVYIYQHVNRTAAVIGGYMYRGLEIPELSGKYVFSDAISGKILTLSKTGQTYKESTLQICDNKQYGHVLSFSKDYDNELYVLTSKTRKPTSRTGSVYKIVKPVDGTQKCRSSSIILSPLILISALVVVLISRY